MDQDDTYNSWPYNLGNGFPRGNPHFERLLDEELAKRPEHEHDRHSLISAHYAAAGRLVILSDDLEQTRPDPGPLRRAEWARERYLSGGGSPQDLEASEAYARQALELARKEGKPEDIGRALWVCVWAASVRGDDTRALFAAGQIIEGDGIPAGFRCAALAFRGLRHLEAGENEEALDDLSAAVRERRVPRQVRHDALRACAKARLAARDYVGAARDILAARPLGPAGEGPEPLPDGASQEAPGERETSILSALAAACAEQCGEDQPALRPPGAMETADGRWGRIRLNRAETALHGGDFAGAVRDASAVLAMPGAPASLRMDVYETRSRAQCKMADLVGEFGDLTRIADSAEEASPLQRARALTSRFRLMLVASVIEGAAADYCSAVNMPGLSPEERAHVMLALKLSVSVGWSRAVRATLYRALWRMPDAPLEQRVSAWKSWADTMRWRGDPDGIMAGCDGVIEAEETPPELRREARRTRAETRERLRDAEGALAEHDAMVAAEGSPALWAEAVEQRAGFKRRMGDVEGARADYSAIVRAQDAPAGRRARAFEGMVSGWLPGDDSERVFAECNAVIAAPGVPGELLAAAHLRMGLEFARAMDRESALRHYDAAVSAPDLPPVRLAEALKRRALTRSVMGDKAGRREDLQRIIDTPGMPEMAKLSAGLLLQPGVLWEEHRRRMQAMSGAERQTDVTPGQESSEPATPGI